MWELGHKEDWALKNWCFQTVVREKTLESPLDSKEIKPVNPKGNQPWIFIGRADAEAEALILWPPDAKSWLIHWKRSWWWERFRAWGEGETEDEMVRRSHRLNGREFEQTPRDSEGQGGLACCDAWGHKESDMTEQLNDNNNHQCSAGWNHLQLIALPLRLVYKSWPKWELRIFSPLSF